MSNITKAKNSLMRRTMRRVRMIFLVRQMTRPPLVKSYIIAVLVGRIVAEASIIDILRNAATAKSFSGHALFYTRALARTDAEMQFAVLGSVLLAVWLLLDVARGSNFKTACAKPLRRLLSSMHRGSASKVLS